MDENDSDQTEKTWNMNSEVEKVEQAAAHRGNSM